MFTAVIASVSRLPSKEVLCVMVRNGVATSPIGFRIFCSFNISVLATENANVARSDHIWIRGWSFKFSANTSKLDNLVANVASCTGAIAQKVTEK